MFLVMGLPWGYFKKERNRADVLPLSDHFSRPLREIVENEP